MSWRQGYPLVDVIPMRGHVPSFPLSAIDVLDLTNRSLFQ